MDQVRRSDDDVGSFGEHDVLIVVDRHIFIGRVQGVEASVLQDGFEGQFNLRFFILLHAER